MLKGDAGADPCAAAGQGLTLQPTHSQPFPRLRFMRLCYGTIDDADVVRSFSAVPQQHRCLDRLQMRFVCHIASQR